MSVSSIVQEVRDRTFEKSMAGGAITTADRYVSNIAECPSLLGMKGMMGVSPASMLKEASGKLVYTNDGLDTMEKATSTESMKKMLGVSELPKHAALSNIHVLTAKGEDRDLDVLHTGGARIDQKMLSLWQHMHPLPVGKYMRTVDHTDTKLTVASVLLDINDLTSDILKLVEADCLRWSHGFRVFKYGERSADAVKGAKGYDVFEFEIMEESYVSVPSLAEAEMEAYATEKFASAFFKGVSREATKAAQTNHVRGSSVVSAPISAASFNSIRYDGESWIEVPLALVMDKSGQTEAKSFDPAGEQLEASRLEYDWATRFIGCEMKDLIVIGSDVPNLRSGTYFTGEKVILDSSHYEKCDQRNLTRDGKEVPLLHRTIQASSTEHVTFMSDGLYFFKGHEGKSNIVVKHTPSWGGATDVTVYSKDDSGQKFLSSCWDWAIKNNMLKGEAFSLTGTFLSRKGITQDEIFLSDENSAILNRTIDMMQKGDKRPRGIIMQGPPGTGKTISCQAIKNQTPATFIWVSARDFWQTGAVGGICSAFDMAKELAPAVVVFEDVDNWIGSHSVDLMKTEMDGMDTAAGCVLTVMTTNYPERLPDALIDRPGRFHDICTYDLPAKSERVAMVERWVPGIEETSAQEVAEKTEGYSGAHMFELCNFAEVLREEDDGLNVKSSLFAAIEKVDSQRTMIDANQLAGSNYRPSGRSAKSSPAFRDFMKNALEVPLPEKGGRRLSGANLKVVTEVRDDLVEMQGMDDVCRPAKAMCKECTGKLNSMIESAAPPEKPDDESGDESDKSISAADALAVLLSSDDTTLSKALATIEGASNVKRLEKAAEDYRAAGLI